MYRRPRRWFLLKQLRRKLKYCRLLSTGTISRKVQQDHVDGSESTIDDEEVRKFDSWSQSWWDANGDHELLHRLNDLRVPLIRDAAIEQLRRKGETCSASKPLTGIKILDAGCGGGILCEPLARLGANVTGLDAGKELIDIARDHASHDNLTAGIEYIHSTVEDLSSSNEGLYDVVVSSEVIEHVNDQSLFVNSCCKLVKKGGSVIMSTINRTRISYLLAILVAERVFLPPGTHDWNKFVTPEELQFELTKNDCHSRLLHGFMYNPVTQRWNWIDFTSLHYIIHAIKWDAAS